MTWEESHRKNQQQRIVVGRQPSELLTGTEVLQRIWPEYAEHKTRQLWERSHSATDR